jgi:hypothetical protein
MTLQDRPYWADVLRRRPGTKLMIFDPLPSYLGRGVNDAKNNELRGILEPFLDQVTRPAGVCLACCTHLNKSAEAKTPVHKIMGSIAYANLARNVHLVVRHPESTEQRVMVQAKCNNAPAELGGVGFRIDRTVVPSPTGDIETSVVVFLPGMVDVDLAGAMGGGNGRKGPEPGKTREIAAWLIGYLRDAQTPVALKDVFAAAGDKGHVGQLKQDSQGKLRWSASAGLYRAAEMIDSKPDFSEGWRIATIKDGARTFWQAVRVNPDDDRPF